MQVIVFELDGSAAIMAAAPNISLTILQIGQKDVPDGLPFWIVDASIITDDYVIEPEVLGEPSGYGGTYQPTPLEV
ncbi:hypothetical protein M989_02147 [Kluyvera georgiana ATCC 51603]|uniref:Uncharacterized protein n=1 Tax=Kluyvera georgiana ATCC 51603 TaxID=1354264 RepID=A0A1B7JYZ9_9ENTR|nr:hypothetical protein [Kluyvera georgiana]OAT53139.1 hypothetical protein M989_02147 [Kluyvera georgiana ATCC 51603]